MAKADMQQSNPSFADDEHRGESAKPIGSNAASDSTDASMEDILASIRQIIADESEEIIADPEVTGSMHPDNIERNAVPNLNVNSTFNSNLSQPNHQKTNFAETTFSDGEQNHGQTIGEGVASFENESLSSAQLMEEMLRAKAQEVKANEDALERITPANASLKSSVPFNVADTAPQRQQQSNSHPQNEFKENSAILEQAKPVVAKKSSKQQEVTDSLSKILFDSLKGKIDNISVDGSNSIKQPVANGDKTSSITSSRLAFLNPDLTENTGEFEASSSSMETAQLTPRAAFSDSHSTNIENTMQAPTNFDEPKRQENSDSILSKNTSTSLEKAFSTLAEVKINKRLENVEQDLNSKIDDALNSKIEQLIRPMLKTWLDDNLPRLVETIVEREIKRITDA